MTSSKLIAALNAAMLPKTRPTLAYGQVYRMDPKASNFHADFVILLQTGNGLLQPFRMDRVGGQWELSTNREDNATMTAGEEAPKNMTLVAKVGNSIIL